MRSRERCQGTARAGIGAVAACLLLAASCGTDATPQDDPCAPAGCAMGPCVQDEVTMPAPVLEVDGSLATIGWSRHPVFVYDPSRVPEALAGQVKNWDFYSVQSPASYVEVTIAELSLFSFAGVIVIDYVTGEKWTGWDLADHAAVRLPTSPYRESGWEHGDNVIAVRFEDGARVLSFDLAGKFGGVDVSGEIRFDDGPDRQSFAVVHPLQEPGSFFYTDKFVAMRASGWVKAADRDVAFDRRTAWGVLDWGRGVWPKAVQWFWAAGYGEVDGRDVAFNLGAGDDAHATASADGIVVDGVIHKTGSFVDAPWTMDPDDPMKPWRMRSPDGRMDLTLTPTTFAPTDMEMGDFYLHGIKVYGTWSGTLVLDDCSEIDVAGLAGFAERSTQRW
jgi:hypothetical protein